MAATLLNPKPLATISEDREFLRILAQGSWEAYRQFVASRLAEILEILRRRLVVRLGHNQAMFPEGSVYCERISGGRAQRDALFLEGREALKAGDCNRAAACFEAAAHRIDGLNREIAINYRAYALIRLDERLRARLLLQPLCQKGFMFPSAYWNLACCLPADQPAEQLRVLSLGLHAAPHPNLLHGAIHLSMALGRLPHPAWLVCLPLTEAVLLFYYLKDMQLTPAEREKGRLRIRAYALCGEPEAPDPCASWISENRVRAFINAMYDRQMHSDVIDFWLRCRQGIGRDNYHYWKLKADYLYQFGRPKRAINAFRSELYCRMELLLHVSGLKKNQAFITATRLRAQTYLRRCFSPEVQKQGYAIWKTLARFENSLQVALLPTDSRTRGAFSAEGETEMLRMAGEKESLRFPGSQPGKPPGGRREIRRPDHVMESERMSCMDISGA